MIILTRRTLLAGTAALTAAGMVPFSAIRRVRAAYHALLVACTDYPNLPPEELADRAEERRRAGARLSAEQCARAGQVRTREHHAAGRRRRRRQWLADPCRDQRGARQTLRPRSSATTSSTCICRAMARSSRRPRPATRPTGSTKSSCRRTSTSGSTATRACPTR